MRKKIFLTFPFIAFVTVFLYRDLVFGKAVITWDLLDFVLPVMAYLKDSLQAGIIPFWNPYILSGEAFAAQPATFSYNPIYFLCIGLSYFTSLHNAFQWVSLGLIVLASYGTLLLLKKYSSNIWICLFGGLLYGQTSFGPLIGQPGLVTALALLPWMMILAHELATKGFHGKRFSNTAIVACLVGFLILSSYFAAVLYILIFVGGYIFILWSLQNKNERPNISHIGLVLLTSGVLGGLVGMVYLWPALEGRGFYYGDLLGSFVSPDVRLRGESLAKDQVVDILRNEKILLSAMTGIHAMAPHRAMWVLGLGAPATLLALGAMLNFWNIKRVRWLTALFFIGVLYVLGPGGLVFEFVFKFVPVLKNVRYPVFAFFLVQIVMAILAAIHLEEVFKKRLQISKTLGTFLGLILVYALVMAVVKDWEFLLLGLAAVSVAGLYWQWKPAFVALVLISVVQFEISGIFTGRSVNIIQASIEVPQLNKIEKRNIEVVQNTNHRELLDSEKFDFFTKDWIINKVPSNHGYSPADSPVYWYLKSKEFLKDIFGTSTNLRFNALKEPMDFKNDNAYLEYLRDEIPSKLSSGVFLNEEFLIPKSLCKISESVVAPNLFQSQVVSNKGCFLFLSNKYFPGWRAKINQEETKIYRANHTFMGVRVPEGHHTVKFYFTPERHLQGRVVSIISLMVIFLLGIYCRFIRK